MLAGVNSIQAEQRESTMIGIAPSRANCAIGVSEASAKDSSGSITSGGIEVTSDEDWSVIFAKRGVFIEEGECELKFFASMNAVSSMLLPATRLPKGQIGGGRLEVEVD